MLTRRSFITQLLGYSVAVTAGSQCVINDASGAEIAAKASEKAHYGKSDHMLDSYSYVMRGRYATYDELRLKYQEAVSREMALRIDNLMMEGFNG
jgi:hypothetical protein